MRTNYILNPNSKDGVGTTIATMGVHVNLKAGQKVQVEVYESGTVHAKYIGGIGNGVLVRSFFSGGMIY